MGSFVSFAWVREQDGVNNNTGDLVASVLDQLASEADMIALVQRTGGPLLVQGPQMSCQGWVVVWTVGLPKAC